MPCVTARLSAAGWRVVGKRGSVDAINCPMPAEAAALGRARALAWYQELVGDQTAEAWRMELSKCCMGEAEIAIGYAQYLAEQVVVRGGDTSVQAPCLSRRATRQALRGRGLHVAFTGAYRMLDRVSILAASGIAWFSLLASALRHVPVAAPRSSGSGWILAVHGEWSNRTRHVLGTIIDRTPPESILVLGRPRNSLTSLRALWSARLGGQNLPPLRRPWSLGSVLASIPFAFRMTRTLLGLVDKAPYLPSFRERIAMLWRTFLGGACAAWAARQRDPAVTIVYGHTGTADTTLLELAQQKAGHTTVHAVHGISSGINFTGCSNVAAFRCGHDAAWHDHLGGYGACVVDAAPRPPVHEPGDGSGVLLLTNLAHPMHPGYRMGGVDEEAAALRLVALASAKIAPPGPRVWKPHPAFSLIPPKEQVALREEAERLGYELLPPESDWRQHPRRFRWIVTTASTTVIELLLDGHLPLMIASDWVDTASVLARYPATARDSSELAELMERSLDGSSRTSMFDIAWSAIRPASSYRGPASSHPGTCA